VWDRPHGLVLDELSENQLIDWSRGCVDSVSVRAKGGELTGRNPTDRGKAGTKYHLLVDAGGLVIRTLLSPANTHDSAASPGCCGSRARACATTGRSAPCGRCSASPAR
jgi:hypothetical protein